MKQRITFLVLTLVVPTGNIGLQITSGITESAFATLNVSGNGSEGCNSVLI